jgi:hypothetical protein
MNMRQLPSREYAAVKAAWRELVDLCGGPNQATKYTRVAASLLSRYGAAHEEMFAPIDVVMDLEAQVGEPVVTRVLADIAGQSLVTKPEARPATDFVKHLGEVGHDTGDVLSNFSAAIADGKVDEKEASALLVKVREAEESLAELESALEEKIDNVTLFCASAH